MENIELLVTKPELLMTKNESKNNNLGKLNKKSIYLNLGKYGLFLNHNKINYKIPEWLPIDKIDLEIASNLIQHKLKYQENKKDSNESE
jgi:topoisomerase IA-like protein